MIFPKVTYSVNEFLTYLLISEVDDVDDEYAEEILERFGESDGFVCGDLIWAKYPSTAIILHEFLHYVGYKLRLPRFFHVLIHMMPFLNIDKTKQEQK